MHTIRMGVPEMAAYWNDLQTRHREKKLNRDEAEDFKKLTKALSFLQQNPRHPGLGTHQIEALSRRYGMKVWQSYLENRRPAAGRLFWVYGPDRGDITILGIEPHPDDKKHAYSGITLSLLPEQRE